MPFRPKATPAQVRAKAAALRDRLEKMSRAEAKIALAAGVAAEAAEAMRLERLEADRVAVELEDLAREDLLGDALDSGGAPPAVAAAPENVPRSDVSLPRSWGSGPTPAREVRVFRGPSERLFTWALVGGAVVIMTLIVVLLKW